MTEKQKHKTAAEVKEEMGQKADEELFKNVSEQIQKVLMDNKCALQPFLQRNDYTGDMPRVRLVRMNLPVQPQAAPEVAPDAANAA